MRILFAMLIVAVLVAIYQCNSSSERDIDVTAWQRNLDDEKNEAIRELNELNEAVEIQLEVVVSKAKSTDDRVNEQLSNVERRLLSEQNKIKSSVKAVRSATENTWDDVHGDVRGKMTDIRIEVSRVKEKIKNEIETKK